MSGEHSNTSAPTLTVAAPAPAPAPPTAAVASSQFRDQVFGLFTELTSLDREIHALEVETAPLEGMVTELVRLNHPSLWLVMGREGIDRPGTIGSLVGQQVVTRYQRDRKAEIRIAIVALVIGVLIGLAALFLLQMAGVVIVP